MLDTSITFPFFFFFFLFSFLIFSVSINFKIFLVSGTYDTSMPSEESVVNWFNVRKSSDETMAMLLDVTVSEEEEAPACWDDAAKQVVSAGEKVARDHGRGGMSRDHKRGEMSRDHKRGEMSRDHKRGEMSRDHKR
eukprot:Colp12_sorted_trinity150504_noHs@19266